MEINFKSDLAIKNRKDDVFNRGPFVRYVVDTICENSKNGLVLGLCGKWGSGKSSIKNLIIDEIDKSKVDILEFNPWFWSGKDRLLEAFFDEISILLEKDSDDKTSSLVSKWNKYASILKFGSSTLKHVKSLVESFDPTYTTNILSLIKKSMDDSTEVLKGGSDVLSSHDKKITMDQRKKELNKHLEELTKPIIVIVDDIDRLSNDEIAQLFQLIKINADFKNITYLLLYDKDIVQQALDKITDGNGKDYIGKIVPFELDIPYITDVSLLRIIEEGIIKTIGDDNYNELRDLSRWIILHSCLCKMIVSMRELKKIIKGIEYSLTLHTINDHLEVDVIDLIGIEALKVCEYNVYLEIKNFRYWFKEKTDKSTMTEEDIEIDNKHWNSIISKSSLKNIDNTSMIIGLLFSYSFPNNNVFFEKGEIPDDLKFQNRICCFTSFYRFFSMERPNDFVPRYFMKNFYTEENKYEDYCNYFKNVQMESQLGNCIGCLIYEFEKIPENNYEEFLCALYDLYIFDLSRYDIDNVLKIIYKILQASSDFKFYYRSIQRTTNLCIALKSLSLFWKINRNNSWSLQNIPVKKDKELKLHLKGRFKKLFQDNSILELDFFLDIIDVLEIVSSFTENITMLRSLFKDNYILIVKKFLIYPENKVEVDKRLFEKYKDLLLGVNEYLENVNFLDNNFDEEDKFCFSVLENYFLK